MSKIRVKGIGGKYKEYQKLTVVICYFLQSKCNKNNPYEKCIYLCENQRGMHVDDVTYPWLCMNESNDCKNADTQAALEPDFSQYSTLSYFERSKNTAEEWIKGNFVASEANGK